MIDAVQTGITESRGAASTQRFPIAAAVPRWCFTSERTRLGALARIALIASTSSNWCILCIMFQKPKKLVITFDAEEPPHGTPATYFEQQDGIAYRCTDIHKGQRPSEDVRMPDEPIRPKGALKSGVLAMVWG